MYEFCIIGAGTAGLCLLLLLQDAGVDLSTVTLVDPYFDGGDLARRWTSVTSNTPWSKTFNALKAAVPSFAARIAEEESALGPVALDNSSSLAAISGLLRRLSAPALRPAMKIQGLATRAHYSDVDRAWLIDIDCPRTQKISSRRLIIATGSEPKGLDIGVPTIPLEVGLDVGRLQHYVASGQKAIVFGTAHSGTLVIRNILAAMGPKGRVTAFYATAEPFYWSRDGHYDGIKREAADIADSVQRGEYAGRLDLVSIQDTASVIRASKDVDWVVFAMGFQARKGLVLSREGGAILATHPFEYDGTTGALVGLPAAWGFGIAYPNRAPDGVHWDVSVAAFLEHMKLQMPALLARQ